MPEPVQGTAVLRKFVTIQSHKNPQKKVPLLTSYSSAAGRYILFIFLLVF